jgi:hypothetical protein
VVATWSVAWFAKYMPVLRRLRTDPLVSRISLMRAYTRSFAQPKSEANGPPDLGPLPIPVVRGPPVVVESGSQGRSPDKTRWKGIGLMWQSVWETVSLGCVMDWARSKKDPEPKRARAVRASGPGATYLP